MVSAVWEDVSDEKALGISVCCIERDTCVRRCGKTINVAHFAEHEMSSLPFHAIVAQRGLLAVTADHLATQRAALIKAGYHLIEVNFAVGMAHALAQLGEALDWSAQFGYSLAVCSDGELPILDAIADGFAGAPFREKAAGHVGVVLVLCACDAAYAVDAHWLRGLCAICSAASLQQIACGQRFFTLVEVASVQSPLVGTTVDSVEIGMPVSPPRGRTLPGA